MLTNKRSIIIVTPLSHKQDTNASPEEELEMLSFELPRIPWELPLGRVRGGREGASEESGASGFDDADGAAGTAESREVAPSGLAQS